MKYNSYESYQAKGIALVRFPMLDETVIEDLAKCDGKQLTERIKKYIEDPRVREAIYLASPELFNRMKEWEGDSDKFNNLHISIARYLLRMSFRATPFGAFSCIGSCEIFGEKTSISFPAKGEIRRSIGLDTSVLANIVFLARRNPKIRNELILEINDTLYVKNGLAYFIAFHRNRKGKRIYKNVEVEWSHELALLVDIVHKGMKFSDVVAKMQSAIPGEFSLESVEEYILSLIESDILTCDALIDITSDNVFGNMLSQFPVGSEFVTQLKCIEGKINAFNSNPFDDNASYLKIVEDLTQAGIHPPRSGSFKVDLVTDDIAGCLGNDVVSKLHHTLNKLVIYKPRINQLNNFKRLYFERYGESEIPLLTIINELEAYGYTDLLTHSPALSRYVFGGVNKENGKSKGGWPESVLSYVLQQQEQLYVDVSVLLQDFSSNILHSSKPRDIVTWISLWEEKDVLDGEPMIEIKSIGAQHPGRIMGRFASSLPAVKNFLSEYDGNDNALIVEIVHLPEDRIGNICGRPKLSEYEIRIRSGGSSSSNSISVDDLMVSVINNRVLLRSRKLNRYLSIRMSNAHSFDRPQSLPLYRFLNHLVNQDDYIESLSLRTAYPDAQFMPGIVCDNLIISRPSWLINNEDISLLRRGGKIERVNIFNSWRVKRNYPSWVTFVQGDNVIPYNLDNEWMLDDLIKKIINMPSVVLSETAPKNMRPYFKVADKYHHHEFQVALKSMRNEQGDNRLIHSSFSDVLTPIWKDWLFLRLYILPEHQNQVLLEMQPVLNQLIADRVIQGYFYVRYFDSEGSHLRLRMRAYSDNALELIFPLLREILDDLTTQRFILNSVISPYVREVKRYGGDASCKLCEEIFFIDSKVAIDSLTLFSFSELISWKVCVKAIDAMLISLGVSTIEERLEFSRKAAGDFSIETKMTLAQKKRIGEIYRATPPLFSKRNVGAEDSDGSVAFYSSIDEILALWERLVSENDNLDAGLLYGIRWSLIHMRLNRIISKEQRLHEAVLWELLKRSYISLMKNDGVEK
ncbi:thiopeptide-type bacteriocin biosynthesis protein [Serratia bockelmannii]|uniref:lantibiotic dehydratase n=1 Tax=Serratia bockelmannii TaxID=2703793 RepID=UPI003FA6EB44